MLDYKINVVNLHHTQLAKPYSQKSFVIVNVWSAVALTCTFKWLLHLMYASHILWLICMTGVPNECSIRMLAMMHSRTHCKWQEYPAPSTKKEGEIFCSAPLGKHFVKNCSVKFPRNLLNSTKATWLPVWACYLPYLMTFPSKKPIKPRLWFLNMPQS